MNPRHRYIIAREPNNPVPFHIYHHQNDTKEYLYATGNAQLEMYSNNQFKIELWNSKKLTRTILPENIWNSAEIPKNASDAGQAARCTRCSCENAENTVARKRGRKGSTRIPRNRGRKTIEPRKLEP